MVARAPIASSAYSWRFSSNEEDSARHAVRALEVEPTRVLRTHPSRRTVLVSLPPDAFVVKRFSRRGWSWRRRRLLRRDPAMREWIISKRLSELRIDHVAWVAWGQNDEHTPESVLVRPFVADSFALDARPLDTIRPEIRRRLATKLGHLIASLHKSNHVHRDLHAGNILATEDGRPLLIDLHPIVRRSSEFAKERDLCSLSRFFFLRATRTDRLRFLRAYAEQRRVAPPFREWVKRLSQKAQKSMIRFLARRSKRPLRPGGAYARLRHEGWRGITVLDQNAVAQSLDAVLQQGTSCLHQSGRSSVHRISTSAGSLCVKLYSETGIKDRLRRLLGRASRARRSWVSYESMRLRDIPVPAPAFFAESPHASVIATEFIADAQHLSDALRDRASIDRAHLLHHLSRTLSRQHDLGLRKSRPQGRKPFGSGHKPLFLHRSGRCPPDASAEPATASPRSGSSPCRDSRRSRRGEGTASFSQTIRPRGVVSEFASTSRAKDRPSTDPSHSASLEETRTPSDHEITLNMKSFWKALRYALVRHRGKLGIALLTAIFAASMRAVSLGALIPFLDVIFKQRAPDYLQEYADNAPQVFQPFVSETMRSLLALDPLHLLATVAGFVLLMMLLRGLLVVIHEAMAARITHLSIRDIASEVYGAVLASPLMVRSGEILARFSTDLEDVRQGIRRFSGKGYMEPLNLVAIASLLIVLHPKLALISMTVFPAAMGATFMAASAIKKKARRILKKRSSLMGVVEQGLRGLTTIRIFGLENREKERFSNMNNALAQQLVKLHTREAFHRPVLELVGASVVVVCLLLGSSYVLTGEMSPGTFIVFYTTLVTLVDPIKKLSNTAIIVSRADASSQRLFETLDEARALMPPPGGEVPPQQIESLELRGVQVRAEDNTILHQVDCEVKKGDILVVAGLSGAGKSTFLKLIPRLIDPTEGQVLINGTDVRDLDLAQWRHRIGYVGQEPFLFGDSIADNIRANQGESHIKDVVHASKLAQSHTFVDKLPDGYDTILDDRSLSAGERQRLTIARALLREPQVLILDEATSALDAINEARFLAEVSREAPDRITILVTHRLDTVVDEAYIVLLRDGHVVSQGRKSELMSDSDHFREITSRTL